ncbi:MAG: 2-oxo acid dehydrogenase subunit E2 [Chloroflexi bacterium]|nr:MAG: 2-oxo acid dehydrogenase subunit E2 [Chloroflexota bacterium]
MAEAIKMPADGLVLNWLKEVGETVSKGEVIVEIEADKATMEVEAPSDGVLLEQVAALGEELSEGTVLGYIGEAGEQPAAEAAPAAASAEAAATPTTQSAPAPAPATTNGAGATRTPEGRIKASPIARRMAEERGIDLSQVSGSGPGGRIVKADIENWTPADAPAAPVSTGAAAPAPAVAGVTWGELPSGEDVEIIDVSRMRSRIAQGTTLSKSSVPHFYVTTEVDVAPMLALRKELNATLAEQGVKITVNDIIVKAAALTLRQFPNLNSHFYGDKIVRHKRIHIGIAVSLPDNGLINVVSRDADRLALGELAVQNRDVISRARDGKIRPEDMRGATFTTSNLGAYDVDHFIAIIDPPQSGILAIGSARQVPVVLEDGTLGVGARMKVTISVDHRVSDGAEGAQFLQAFKALLENPMRLLV